MTSIVNNSMVTNLGAHFQKRYEAQFSLAQTMALHMALPGLRGFWPMSAINESGNVIDQSGQGRVLTKTGTILYTHLDGLFCAAYSGGAGELVRADESGLSITGTESYFNSLTKGLTFGGWFQFGSVASDSVMIAKWLATGNQESYILYITPSQFSFAVSPDGTTPSAIYMYHTTTPAISTWYHVVARFKASTSMDLWVNGVKATRTTSIPASIYDSTASLEIFARNSGTNIMTGYAAMCFLCASYVTDTTVFSLYQQGRAMFGV